MTTQASPRGASYWTSASNTEDTMKKKTRKKIARKFIPARDLTIRLLVDGIDEYSVSGPHADDDLDLVAARAARRLVESVRDYGDMPIAVQVDDELTGTEMYFPLSTNAEAVRLAKQLVATIKAFQVVSGLTHNRLSPVA